MMHAVDMVPAARVLVAEDNEELSILLNYNMEVAGYTVDCVSNGYAALEILRAQKYDAVVLDWMLPGLSGIAVLAALRREPLTRSTPVIVLTARTDRLDRKRALDTGADVFLPKPFSLVELMSWVNRLSTIARQFNSDLPRTPSEGLFE
jgi:two-component system, OmpR family, phosphate regulon response regulator PhoB